MPAVRRQALPQAVFCPTGGAAKAVDSLAAARA